MRIATFTLILLLAPPAVPAACEASTSRPLPLLELYTSEGCSSCPPADRWMTQLVAAGIPLAAVPLAFHVGYWDSLGWKDRFADPAHEVRQRARVAAAGERVVYTPQAMLGTDVQAAWRDRTALAAAASRWQDEAPELRVLLQATPTATGYDIAVEAAGEGEWQVQLALYGDGLRSQVTAGENRAVTLHHDRVVRALYGPWSIGAQRIVPVALPEEAGTAQGIVAMLSRRGERGTGWALDLPLAGCAPAG